MERKINIIKEVALWIYIAVILAGTIYAAIKGQTTKSPGQIIYESTRTM